MRELGAYLRVGGVDDETARALPVVIDAETLTRLETSTWRTDAGDIDVLVTIRDSTGARLTIADIEARAVEIEVVGVVVRLASLHDIIESKTFADRIKDREALPELERLRDDPGKSVCNGSATMMTTMHNDGALSLGPVDRLPGARRGRTHAGTRRTRSPRRRR